MHHARLRRQPNHASSGILTQQGQGGLEGARMAATLAVPTGLLT